MTNPVITNVDLGRCVEEAWDFSDELLVFAGADTFVEGTILARREVATAITPSAVTGTGNGTVTAATVVEGPVQPLVGNYTLRAIAAATHGGTFRLEDPNGAIVSGNLVMTAGAGGASIFEAAGLRFTINDGSTDFAVGDTFTLPVVIDGKMVPFAVNGAAGAGVPIAILGDASVRTGAGNNAIRAVRQGRINKRRLVIDADGDATNVTTAILDQLRAKGFVVDDAEQLAVLDNQ